MRITYGTYRTMNYCQTGKFRWNKHAAFNVNMAVNKSGKNVLIRSIGICLFNAMDDSIFHPHMCRVYFFITDINQFAGNLKRSLGTHVTKIEKVG